MDKQMETLFEKIKQEMEKQITSLTSKIDKKLEPVLEENRELKKEVSFLKSKITSLEKATRKNNFVLHGVIENEKGTTGLLDLVLEILNILNQNTKSDKWDKWEISHVQRLGAKRERKNRPILVTVTLAWRKIEVLRNNKHLPDKIFATEDYPKEVLQKRKDLKLKMKEEIEKGNIAYIRYDKLIVKEANNEMINQPTTSSVTMFSNKNQSPQNQPTKRILSESPELPRSGNQDAPKSNKQPIKKNKTNIKNYVTYEPHSIATQTGKPQGQKKTIHDNNA